jgi:hypothetical protein
MEKLNENIEVPPPEVAELPPPAPTEWFEAFNIVEPYVVKIITPEGSGSGFLLGCSNNQELIGIATAE